MSNLKLFAIILPVFLLIDLLWLGVIMKDFYSRELGDLARRSGESLAPRWGAALLVYVLLPAGIVLLVRPAIPANSTLAVAAAWGAIYGLITYGVYDLTCLAVLDKWSVRMTVVDMAWGATLCGVVACVMRFVEARV
jgi:uncharacterized membrane protein